MNDIDWTAIGTVALSMLGGGMIGFVIAAAWWTWRKPPQAPERKPDPFRDLPP